jgi:DnaJ-class molecular chaperone
MKERCRRCAGTGKFITYVENGVPKGPGGPCYRCNGKGYLTTRDERRNWGYDNFYRRVDY